jgi:hypothetical protein
MFGKIVTFTIVFSSIVSSVNVRVANSQDMGVSIMKGLAESGLEASSKAIKRAPNEAQKLLDEVAKGKEFPSEEVCLQNLQTLTTAAAGVSNLYPFSTVWTSEDERGPVVRMRLLISGKKIHLEAACEGTKLIGQPKPWINEVQEPQIYQKSTLNLGHVDKLLNQIRTAAILMKPR